jgi:myo-inositol-1(or 4)-monophosphatase
MQPIVRVASQAARKASEVILRGWRDIDILRVEEKSPNDFVTAVDRSVEKILIEEISRRFPTHRFVGEELGEHGPEDAEAVWYIDPLDGTTNFIRGIGHFAISLGCQINGRMEHALVYDPIKDEEFSASRGQSARLNGRRIRVADRKSLEGSLLATGIPFSGATAEHMHSYLAATEELLTHSTSGIRRLGAAALDLAYVAAGRYDGFYEINLKPWDIAAGSLIVREAGGLVTDLAGNSDYLNTGHIICASPKVFREMLPITKKHLGYLNAS